MEPSKQKLFYEEKNLLHKNLTLFSKSWYLYLNLNLTPSVQQSKLNYFFILFNQVMSHGINHGH